MPRASDPEQARLAATEIVRRLRAAGHAAYFAGGCVRDELLGLHPTDYDVATDAPPQRIRALFKRTSEVGAAFGVMLVYDDDLLPARERSAGRSVVEVATFRSDGPYSDSRRPDVVHFSDAPSDAARRDFTINALFLDPLGAPEPEAPLIRGQIVDYVGGVADLRARLLRAVGDPDQRLAEDHLRALRAVRFAARLGFDIDPATASAIRRHAAELKGVSRERIGEELRRMLTHPARAAAVALLESLNLDAPVLGEPALRAAHTSAEASSCLALLDDGAARAAKVLPRAQTPALPAALAAWALDRAAAAAGVSPSAFIETLSDAQADEWLKATPARYRAALCLSNDEAAALFDILRTLFDLLRRWQDGSLKVAQQKRLAARDGFPAGAAILLGAAGDEAQERILMRCRELQEDGVGVNPPPALTGDDLVAAGYTPGPRFKAVLDEVRDAQLEGRLRSKAEALELARRLCV